MTKNLLSEEQEQFAFVLPTFQVIEAVRTGNWHEVHEAKDIVQPPEWALYRCLLNRSKKSLTMADDSLGFDEIEISLPELQAELCMCKSSLQRSLKRLSTVKWITFKSGKGRGHQTKYLVYNRTAIEQIVKTSGCTHYCMQGEKRVLYRDTASSHIDRTKQG